MPLVKPKLVLTVKNTSTVNQTNSNPSNPIIVHFYEADNAGEPTGAILATITLTGPIPAQT